MIQSLHIDVPSVLCGLREGQTFPSNEPAWWKHVPPLEDGKFFYHAVKILRLPILLVGSFDALASEMPAKAFGYHGLVQWCGYHLDSPPLMLGPGLDAFSRPGAALVTAWRGSEVAFRTYGGTVFVWPTEEQNKGVIRNRANTLLADIRKAKNA